MLGGIMGSYRQLHQDHPFEMDVEAVLGDRIRESDDVAKDLWSALANVDWLHPEHGEAGYSFRAAGDLIAAIRQDGDYMDWYCCAPYPIVSNEIEQALASRGWTWKLAQP